MSANLPVTVVDDETPAITFSPASVALEENSASNTNEVTYTVALATPPTGSVTVSIVSKDPDAVSVSPAMLTFTSTAGQTVTLTGEQDDDGADESVEIEHTASGGEYDNVSKDLPVTVNDDDRAINISPTSLTLNEGGTGAYDVWLNTQPTNSVTVTITTTSDTQAIDITSPEADGDGVQKLTFTSSNWSDRQTVTLVANEDNFTGDKRVTITHTSSSNDTGYVGLTGAVQVQVKDNDSEGIVFSAANNEVELDEGGAEVAYEVTLSSQPRGNVTVKIESGDAGAVSVSPVELTFASNDYNKPQNVTLNAVLDDDGANEDVDITHTARGGGYFVDAVLTAKVTDKDRGITLSPATLDLVKNGDAVSYAVKLNAAPNGAVTIALSSSDPGAVSVNPAELVFTEGNYKDSRNVTLTPVSDSDSAAESVTVSHIASGGGYNGVSADMTAKIIVADKPPTPTSLRVSVAAGAATLNWSSGGNGGSPIKHWEYVKKEGDGEFETEWTKIPDSGPNTVSYTLTGLTKGVTYQFKLRAVSAAGAGAESGESVPVTIGTPSFGDATIPDQSYTQNLAITQLILPPASGGDGTLTYALTPEPPAGLTFDMATRALSGTPAEPQESVTYAWTATDADGDEATLTFSIAIAVDKTPSFGDAAIPDQSYPQDSAITQLILPQATGGEGTLTYSLSPAPPAGLSLDTATRALSGTPTELQEATTYTWTVTDADGREASLTFSIAIAEDKTPSFGDAVIPDQSYLQDSAITQLILSQATGGEGTLTYSLSPAPPAGLSLDAAARALSGTPAEPQEATTYAWTVTDADGRESSLTFSIAIAADQKPSFGDAAIPDQSYVQDSAITQLVLPQATGGDGTLDYSLSPEAPPGLSFDAAARALSGTPAEPREVMTYTWTATDKDGDQASLTFTIEVERDQAPSFGDTVIPDQSYVQNSVIADLTLPEATDGNGTLTYALSPEPLPGLSFDATTRTLSGAPAELAEATAYTWTATDEDGDEASLTFTIEVEQDDAPSFDDAEIAAQSWKQNIPIEPLALPAASGGNGDLAYALTPEPPAGLSFDAAARALSGTPAEPLEETAYTWTATDVDGDAVALTFTLTVEADLSPSFDGATVTDQRYELSVAIEPLTLPAASGGDGDLTYELSPEPPAGLTLDPARRTLSGTPVAGVAKQTYTWTVTDSDSINPDSASLTFTIEVMAFKAADKAVLSDALAAQGRALLTGATTVIGERFRGGGAMASAGAGDDDSAGNQTVAAFDAVAGLLISTNPGNGANMVSPSQPGFGGAMAHTSGATFPATGFSRDANNQAPGAAAFPQVGFTGGATGQMPGAAFPQSGFSGSDPTAPARENDSTTSYLDRLLWGRSFAMPLTTGAEGEDQREWTLWGAGDLQNFQGTPDSGRYDGELRSVYVGADTLLSERWLAGAALSLSQGELNYAANGGSSGQVDTDLTSVYPYIRGELSSGLEVWALGGFGRGEVVNELEESGLSMAIGAAGLRRSLAEWSGFKLSVVGGAGYVSLSTDTGDRLTDSLDANVQRVRLALEASGTGALAPYLQVGGLYDGGDGQTGAGVEAVAGLRYRGERLDFEARGRWLLSHAAQGYEEYGAMARLTLKSRADGAGLQLSLAPTWGAAGAGGSLLGGGEALLSSDAGAIPGMGSGLAVPGLGADGRSLSLTSEIGYGLLVSRLNGLLKPMVAYDRGASQNLTRFGLTYEYLRSEIRDDIDLRFGVSWQPARAEMEADYRLEVKFLKTF